MSSVLKIYHKIKMVLFHEMMDPPKRKGILSEREKTHNAYIISNSSFFSFMQTTVPTNAVAQLHTSMTCKTYNSFRMFEREVKILYTSKLINLSELKDFLKDQTSLILAFLNLPRQIHLSNNSLSSHVPRVKLYSQLNVKTVGVVKCISSNTPASSGTYRKKILKK